MSFVEFSKLSPEERDWYVYTELQKQKSDLKWYATIFTAVMFFIFEIVKNVIRKFVGVGT